MCLRILHHPWTPLSMHSCPSPGASNATILVLQEVRKVEKLWDELLHIGRALQPCLPSGCHRVELSIRAVEAGGETQPGSDDRYRGIHKTKGSIRSCQEDCVPSSPPFHHPGAHRPLCSWTCREVKGSTRMR